MYRRIIIACLLLFGVLIMSNAQNVTVTGVVTDDETHKPVEFATIIMQENGRWAMSDSKGVFRIKDVPKGKTTITIQCLGYATRQLVFNITTDIPRMRIGLKQDNLKLAEVTVTAKRKREDATTSYTIDRTALDNQQLVNLADVATLLPGGKSVNPTLMDDERMSIRSGGQEKGYASFGTAIEIDGMRMGNNSEIGETAGASTRTVSTSNIESVEVVAG
ncbi:MAG: TonB-dependent receptor, partial [Prevotella sp.]|nr:TonB-dependent receptor [Prevotella sp.]